jgi:hypothetical protein
MIFYPPPLKRQRRIVYKPKRARPAPTALTLVSVAYDYDAVPPTVTLNFDRAIDAAGVGVGTIHLLDGTVLQQELYNDGAHEQPTATSVRVALESAGQWVDVVQLLTAEPGNGIVAASDGRPWAGVTDLGLPFPPA